ncbi:MAG: NADH-quinone oxidoreductase subunit M [Actinomycetaceae bacterium]|nr:NADH-quinone oxidoreductase subunit M [Actinomycetaceae bacterium]
MEMQVISAASVPWLSILIALPAVVGLLVATVAPLRLLGRPIALIVSLLELMIGITAATTMDWTAQSAYQLAETREWIPRIGVSWGLGVNQLAMAMILLALALVPIVLIAGWREDSGKRDAARNSGMYMALILILEGFMVLIFAARDVVLFYIAFEAMLIPLYFMIGRFGGKNSRAAALKFLLYSLFGGLIMLAGVIGLWVYSDRSPKAFLVEHLSTVALPANVEMWLFISFFIAFAIKAPMVPVHTWLPDTAAAARPGTSVLLVGVLDKIGTYGMIMLALPLFPNASVKAAPVIIALAVISILYGGLAAIGQKDIMRLVSFTSVSHFGFMVLGIYIGSHIALVGAMFYMVAHGVSIAAMFLISGFLTERGGTREIPAYRGMQRVVPVIAGTWLISGLASVALPGLSGFVPEFLVLMGTWKVSPLAAVFAVLGVVLAALYLLIPYQAIFTGPPAKNQKFEDMNMREKSVIAPLLVAMVVLGIWSAPLVDALNPVAQTAFEQYSAAAVTDQNLGASVQLDVVEGSNN